MGIGKNEFVFLTLGSLRPYKGHLDLVRAFTSVATTSDRLVIAGATSQKDYLAELQTCIDDARSCKNDIRIDLHTKKILDDELQLYFNSANVCVLPFQRILNSGSLLLAMSFGKPVIAPKLGSIPEVAHPESCVVYDSSIELGLPEALRTGRKKFSNFTAERSIIDFTRMKYDWNKIGIDLRSFYTQLSKTHDPFVVER